MRRASESNKWPLAKGYTYHSIRSHILHALPLFAMMFHEQTFIHFRIVVTR